MASTTIANSSFFLLIISLAFSFLSLLHPSPAASSDYNVSAVFAFSDSTIDSGNSNHVSALFRSDHLPYGRDLPSHVPSGRFSNGKLSTDLLAHILGLKDPLPAYLDPHVSDRDLLTGVSFGSAGSGLDNLTATLSRVIEMSRQFELFEEALRKISKQVGEDEARNIVENALFVISVGTNDVVYNGYLLPMRKIQYGDISSYQDFLIQNLESFSERVYNAGGRRIVVTGLPPVGCLPLVVTVNSVAHNLRRTCNLQYNTHSQVYNIKLLYRIHSLQATLLGAKIAYLDIYTPLMDMILNPSTYGFRKTLRGCCGTGPVEMGPTCDLLSPTCSDPSKYMFWDAIHPAQAAYSVLVDYAQQTASIPYSLKLSCMLS